MSFIDLREVLFLSVEENMISDEEFLLFYDEYSSKNPEFEPLVSTWELAFWSPRPQLKNVLTCCKNTSGWRPRYQERLVLKFPSDNRRRVC